MTKKRYLLGLLALALILSGCASKAPAADTQVDQPTIGAQAPAMVIATQAPLPEGIDPSAEEDTDAEFIGTVGSAVAAATEAPSNLFAGATPIPLDPIDMPTPTKAPPLTFTYASYVANGLGLTFESVAGYTINEPDTYTYTLTEPQETVKDNYPVTISLSIRPVNNNYKATDIRADLRQMLKDLSLVNYQRWEPSGDASRSLMNAQGYYANYRGVMTDGTIVRGRVHMALLPNNRLLILHISNPANFNTDYENVYGQIRRTMKML